MFCFITVIFCHRTVCVFIYFCIGDILSCQVTLNRYIRNWTLTCFAFRPHILPFYKFFLPCVQYLEIYINIMIFPNPDFKYFRSHCFPWIINSVNLYHFSQYNKDIFNWLDSKQTTDF